MEERIKPCPKELLVSITLEQSSYVEIISYPLAPQNEILVGNRISMDINNENKVTMTSAFQRMGIKTRGTYSMKGQKQRQQNLGSADFQHNLEATM